MSEINGKMYNEEAGGGVDGWLFKQKRSGTLSPEVVGAGLVPVRPLTRPKQKSTD